MESVLFQFKKNFQALTRSLHLNNSAVKVTLDNFNSRSYSWCSHNVSIKTGNDMKSTSPAQWPHPLITEPTHMFPYYLIDLMFADQLNLPYHNGIDSSLHLNYHYQKTHCKLNLEIIFLFPIIT